MTETDKKLLAEAKRVRDFAYCPYSKFAVGAAVLGASGEIYGGCNVENAAYSVTNCAERTAIYNAVSAGEEDILALAVVTESSPPATPCGACRQVVAEFRIPRILIANLAGEVKEMTLSELLPDAFSGEDTMG
jgi:cytidine deaminase